MRSAPPRTAAFADSPVPAPAPMIGRPWARTARRRASTSAAGEVGSCELGIGAPFGRLQRSSKALGLVDGVQDGACCDRVTDARDVGITAFELDVEIGDRLVPTAQDHRVDAG